MNVFALNIDPNGMEYKNIFKYIYPTCIKIKCSSHYMYPRDTKYSMSVQCFKYLNKFL